MEREPKTFSLWGTHIAQGQVCLFNKFLDLPQHVHLHIFQLLLVGAGVSDTRTVGGLCLLSLETQTHTVCQQKTLTVIKTIIKTSKQINLETIYWPCKKHTF